MASDTECPLCWEIETPRVKRIARNVRKAILGPTHAEHFQAYARAQTAWVNVAMGRKPKGWYEKHRKAFEESGDAKEFERMLRHVKEGE